LRTSFEPGDTKIKVESDENVARVRANGVPVEYVFFHDEDHGFQKKENGIKALARSRIFRINT